MLGRTDFHLILKDQLINPKQAEILLEHDDLRDIVEECSKVLDESINILSDVEFELDSSREDLVSTSMTKNELVDMAHEVADSIRIRKAESSFVRRHFESSNV